MPYTKFSPHPFLRPYVSDYFIWTGKVPRESPFSITSSAMTCSAMVFNFGDRYYLSNAKYRSLRLPQHFLSGLSTASYTLSLTGKIAMAGIIFRGSAYRTLFEVPPAKEFMDDRLDLNHVLPASEIEHLTEQLALAPHNEDRIAVLNAWLLKKIANPSREISIADRAAQVILEKRGMLKMDRLSEELCVSPRQLRRVFKERMGVNPKYFARIKRFNYVNLCLTRNVHQSWRGFLEDEAYYDQSHLIKDYQEFFGAKPSLQITRNRQQSQLLVAGSQ